jgi:hypothetical protein
MFVAVSGQGRARTSCQKMQSSILKIEEVRMQRPQDHGDPQGPPEGFANPEGFADNEDEEEYIQVAGIAFALSPAQASNAIIDMGSTKGSKQFAETIEPMTDKFECKSPTLRDFLRTVKQHGEIFAVKHIFALKHILEIPKDPALPHDDLRSLSY